VLRSSVSGSRTRVRMSGRLDNLVELSVDHPKA
jgi:hypothetical protein